MNALYTLFSILTGLFVSLFLLRFLLEQTRSDFRNPVSQVIVRVTNPIVMPLRRVVPGLGGMDVASLVAAFAAQVLVLVLEAFVFRGGALPGIGALLLRTVIELILLMLYLYTLLVFLRVILSWVSPDPRSSPVVGIVYSLTEPVMAPFRRIIPPIGGLDLSPIVVLVLLQVATVFVSSDLPRYLY